ncbi:pyruvate, phosphate dikinase [Rhodobacteraceae bacterium KN286]|uniref:Pyruvate, phosphate dikinase n=2 Tax=Oceanomicrobium pacificus TaxID=2692916 RepID=A0A6B0TLU9_9RHOB|nr:pyruvate, phosphate dikinase [Oceanomicrobium pacificus]
MAALGLPVPDGLILPADLVSEIATGAPVPDLGAFPGAPDILSIRSSPERSDWGGPTAILNIGLSDRETEKLAATIGAAPALDLYRRFIQSFGTGVAGLDPEDFENLYYDQLKLAGLDTHDGLDAGHLSDLVDASKDFYADEVGEPFPQDPHDQLRAAIRAMAEAWARPSARILRQARGADPEAGTALILQTMALGIGQGLSGSGLVQMVDADSGKAVVTGRFLPQSQGQDALMGVRTPHLITRASREAEGQSAPALEELAPDALTALQAADLKATEGLRDRFQFEFTLDRGQVWLLDAMPAKRSARGAVAIAVDLADRGIITREEAILRIDPRNLIQHLHPQIDPDARRDVFGTGLAASPGAATGRIVFSAEAALAMQAQGEAPILVRIETSPEDIRGMHAAVAVLTARGGMTSHAAVVARGLGLPCVVGASDIRLNLRKGVLTVADGRKFNEGAVVTIDGTRGEALMGAARMIQPELGGAYAKVMDWSDDIRTLGVRANADTPQDGRLARQFDVDGIGLCRTEHMFFEEDRIHVMRQMIMADDVDERRAALDRLQPIQRADFEELFAIMQGLPVVIRLLDPPLHEFLPHGHDEMQDLAEAMDLPVSQVTGRAEELREFNPMLGKRGVRLGITMPEIYEMQSRAIFEATLAVNRRADAPVVPEIMIPLVSAYREVEMIKSRIDAIAQEVQAQAGEALSYKLGVMVETPRAALRAGDLAASSAFLSFGTNDLTQMTYGLSRDDAGRFMRDYVNAGVFPEDPFHSLDVEGVGELLLLAANRGRAQNPDLVLGLCGEHGGDPASIRFCQVAGFDYVSCSPFRVPIARLAAAQATLLSRRDRGAADAPGLEPEARGVGSDSVPPTRSASGTG